MNEPVDLQAFEYVVSKVTDGFMFEKFAQDLLCQIVGTEFVPLGGVRDRGLDGLDHTWQPKSDDKTIYQISIEADPRSKIFRTVQKLKENGFTFARLSYVTNREVREPDRLMEEVWAKEEIVVQIRDLAWLRGNVAKSEGTVRVYADFVRHNTHTLPVHSSNLLVADFAADPRVFVFLRQQLDAKGEETSLRDLLVDSLILFGLEGTDPDKGILRSRSEIIGEICKAIKFPINQIEGYIDGRLDALANKPRQINHHAQQNKYCLPYETRLRLDQQHVRDAALFDHFSTLSKQRLAKHLKLQKVEASQPDYLLSQTFNQVFRKQGLDFADFVLNEKDPKVVETALPEVVRTVLDNAGVPPTARSQVSSALLGAIREIIYRGTQQEHEYLRKLARSYMVLFLVQCDPHVCSYFDSLASKLRVFVCNSILVPALSEICIPKENRRFWNLLVQARTAGVRLYVNRVTLDELVGHIRLALKLYHEDYEGLEEHYSDERTLRYVRPILIRAYLYTKAQGESIKFDEFIYKFASPQTTPAVMAQEMITFLQDEFGVQFCDEKSLGIKLDAAKCRALASKLEESKRTQHQAENDSRTILTIYGLREKDNESGHAGIFGFRTWWLSMDTTTYRAVRKCFKEDRSLVSCYLRPDFLLHYIALSARSSSASKVFDTMFPTMVGVSMAHHVSDELSRNVHNAIKRHKDLSSARVKAVIGSLSTQLMTEGTSTRKKHLRHIFDEAFRTEVPPEAKSRISDPKKKSGSRHTSIKTA